MSGPSERPSGDPAPSSPETPEAPAKAAESIEKVTAPASAPTLRAVVRLFDFGAWPNSRLGWIVRGVVTALLFIVLARRVGAVTRPMLSARPPAPIPTTSVGNEKFGLPEPTRRAMFQDLAAAEIAERARALAKNSWNGHLWSREDDRGYQERIAVRAAAAKYRTSISQVYLVLDEGIRERWPGPDGQPLAATTPPLNIRSNSW
jgi:hypothetical protein